MSELVATGPPVLDLRWSQRTEEVEGRLSRELYPKTHHRADPGYLHPGVAAAACLGAARLIAGPVDGVTSLAIAQAEPVPLDVDLRAVVPHPGPPGERDVRDSAVEIQHLHPPPGREDVVDPLLVGSVHFGGYTDAPDLDDVRELARGPVPEERAHDLHAGCWVCGQAGVEGLSLLPGWVADGRVVTRFIPDERFGDDLGRIGPDLMATVLACPTLWCNRHHLRERAVGGAVLTDYEVHIHDEPRISTVLRTVGYDGEPDEERVRGMSALADEDGRIYASAFATWHLLDHEPAREPGEPTPRERRHPLKGGRPENRSPDEWGRSLPGRREMPGARTDAVDTYARMEPDPDDA